MQQFKTFKSRRLEISKASQLDIKNYKVQVQTHSPVKDKINILKSETTSYLSVKNEDSKLIGLIQVDEIDEKAVHVKICVPNNSWNSRYGTEALHQFIKCCKERKLYKRVYFKTDNSIVKEYNKQRPEVLVTGYYIDIA